MQLWSIASYDCNNYSAFLNHLSLYYLNIYLYNRFNGSEFTEFTENGSQRRKRIQWGQS